MIVATQQTLLSFSAILDCPECLPGEVIPIDSRVRNTSSKTIFDGKQSTQSKKVIHTHSMVIQNTAANSPHALNFECKFLMSTRLSMASTAITIGQVHQGHSVIDGVEFLMCVTSVIAIHSYIYSTSSFLYIHQSSMLTLR